MKLIFIYGAPGVGKLTVAKELAKLTGYRLFHNHLTVDLAASVFEHGTPEYIDVVHSYRVDLIGRAARAKVRGMIFTFMYEGSMDDKFIADLVAVVKQHKGQALFVHLICDTKELFKRIKHPSRKKFMKVKKAKTLKGLLKLRDFSADVPYKDNFTIDNTKLSPKKTAEKIKKYYRL